ncbi:LodA/GoxA family CTQ-dependent oxidase [Streptomyces triculaminicus]|uniref:LodA/GoxA family CTQ-dependent oxidase n=1 Tax=Streptomyces triculaminicus TaxID=2816232 RepID=UPI0037D8CFBE
MSDDIAFAKIHPAIGVARVGNSTDPDGWFLDPETPEPQPAPPGSYKDSQGAVKRQAARFRLYGYDAAGHVVREIKGTEPGADLTWSVHLANKKGAWYAFNLALDIDDSVNISSPRRNNTVTDRSQLVIDPGRKSLHVSSGQTVEFTGGKFLGQAVPLGRMHADGDGRLVVLGGAGAAKSPQNKPLTSFANNDGWYDDTSDGPVTAQLTLGGQAVPVHPAWLVVAPPNYAPDVKTLRTVYDLLVDLFVDEGTLPAPTVVSFERDIKPILRRFCELQWVNKGFATHFGFGGPEHFMAPETLRRLSATGDTHQELRRQIYTALRDRNRDHIAPMTWPWLYGDGMASKPKSDLQYMTLSKLQDGMLLKWVKGDFDPSPWAGFPHSLEDAPVADQPGLLDRAALDFCLADAFHPGCEVTWSVRHPSMYSEPFRIQHRPAGQPEPDYGAALTQQRVLAADGPLHAQAPGGLTRWMAVPWQTDTASCRWGYEFSRANLGPRYDPHLPTFWPARVPNHVLKESDYHVVNDSNAVESDREDAFARRASWLRGLSGNDPKAQLVQAVKEWHKFGIVEVRPYTVGDGKYPERLQVESVPGFDLTGVSDDHNLVNIHVDEAVSLERVSLDAVVSEISDATGYPPEVITVGYIDKLDPYGEGAAGETP